MTAVGRVTARRWRIGSAAAIVGAAFTFAAAPARTDDARRAGELRLGRRSSSVPYLSGPVPDPTAPPLRTNGKSFGKISGLGRHECSATVVDTAGDSTVFTAGHCKATKLVGGVGK